MRGVLGRVEGGELIAEGQLGAVGLDDLGEVVALQRDREPGKRTDGGDAVRERSLIVIGLDGLAVAGDHVDVVMRLLVDRAPRSQVFPVGVGVLGQGVGPEIVDGVEVDVGHSFSRRSLVDYTTCSVGECGIRCNAIVWCAEEGNALWADGSTTGNPGLASASSTGGGARYVCTQERIVFAGAIGQDGDLGSRLHADGRDELIGQELTGKVAVVTGGSSGIGRATAELFVDEGASVVIADVDVEQGEQLAEELGGSAAFKRTDVADGEQVQDLVDYAVAQFGGLDVMFNNAGISSSFRRLLANDLRDFDRVMAVNLLGVMVGTRCAARHMAEHGGGSIINTTSMGALTGGALPIVYRTSKAAVIQFSRAAATDLAEYDIRVNCIAPGHISTGITNYDLGPVIRLSQPLQRQGTPADVANAVLFLAGERSAQVTGIVVPVDGGTAAGPSIKQTMLLAEGSQGGADAG